MLLLLLLTTILSCSDREYYTLSDFASVPKADVHIHVRTERSVFPEQAIRDNFKLVNIVVDGDGNWASIEEQFAYALAQKRAYPDQYQVITSFSLENFHEPGWQAKTLDWIGRCLAEGATGIKVWKNIGMVLTDTNGVNVMLDDPRFDAIFNRIEESEKIVVGHLGEPLNCWLPLEEMTTNNDRSYFREHPQYHMYLHPELPSYDDQIKARNQRLDKHPNLRFVGAHLASLEWNVDSLADWFDRYPEATADLAARMGQIFWQTQQDRERVRNFFIKYQDRILYATDMGDEGDGNPEAMAENMHETWLRDWQYFVTDDLMTSDLVNGEFKGIRLPREAVDKIFFGNAARVFGF